MHIPHGNRRSKPTVERRERRFTQIGHRVNVQKLVAEKIAIPLPAQVPGRRGQKETRPAATTVEPKRPSFAPEHAFHVRADRP